MRAARPRVAWGLATAGVTIAAAAAAFEVANRSIDSPPGLRPHLPGDLLLTAALCAFLLVGALVAARRPGNPVGWLLLAEGLVWELGLFCAGYVGYAVYTRPGSLPVPELAAWTLAWIWAAGLAGLPLLLGLFPGGLWPGRRWRVVGVAAVASLVLSAASWALRPGSLVDVESLANPVGLNGAGAALDVLGAGGGLLLSASLVAAIAAFVVRYRRASTLERAQLKWFAVAVAVIATGFATASVLGALGVPDTVTSYFNTVPMAALPIAVGVALLRHRLYEIDTVIDRALVATGLAAFATAVYLALVVAAGAAVGRGTGSSAVLVALATAIVAVAFQPLHAPAVYTPEVLARFDVIGMDPRGVARSTPVRCFADSQEQGEFLGTLPAFPVGHDEERSFADAQAALGQRCQARNGELLRHLSTANVARDLDLLRRAVGDPKLTYIGHSYGTMLGATYANLFPGNVRAIALDSVLDPVGYTTGRGPLGGHVPFSLRVDSQRATSNTLRFFLDTCREAGDRCAFSSGDPVAESTA